MKVMYTCDNNYIWFMGISVISLLENNKNANNIEIYLLGKDITKESKTILSEIVAKYNREIFYYDIKALPIPCYLETNGRWPLICYARLFASNLLPDVDRILYLDCDTIVVSDLSDLFTDKFLDCPVYGAKDFIGSAYKKNIGMFKESVVINGGVLLFNLGLYRAMNPNDKIQKFVEKYGRFISYADQDILNGTFSEQIGYLDASYNVTTIMKLFSYKEIKQLKHPLGCYEENEVVKAVTEPKIIHYTDNYRTERPWIQNSTHPYAKEFYKYKDMSPWKNIPLMQQGALGGEKSIAIKIRKLPTWFSCNLLGFLYCVLRPLKIKVKGLCSYGK